MLTLEWLRVRAGLAEDDSSQDGILVPLRDQATAYLGRALGRYLGEPTTKTEIRSGGCSCSSVGLPALYLWDDPTEPDPAVTVSTRAKVGDPWEALDASEFSLEGRLLSLTNGARFPSGGHTVQIEYLIGFALGEGPEELQAMVGDLVVRWYKSRTVDPGLASEKIGDYSYTRFSGEDVSGLPGLRDLIARWRRRVV